MRLTKFDRLFDTHMRDLALALGRLKPTQLRTSRGNARTAVILELGRMRKRLDDAFPRVPKDRKSLKRTRRLGSWTHFKARMEKAGYQACVNSAASELSERGVRIRRFGPGSVGFAPLWAILALNINKTYLRQAKKSIAVRRALLAAHRLGAGTTSAP